MGKRRLTRLEALNLITPVVDQEASEQECEAFYEYIAKHPDVRRKFESAKNIKELLSERSLREKAPDSLKNRIEDFLSTDKDALSHSSYADEPVYDVSCQESPASFFDAKSEESEEEVVLQPGFNRWIFSAVASLLIVITAWTFYGFSLEQTAEPAQYYVEESAYDHFEEYKKQFVEPSIVTASLGLAEAELASDYDMPITIPKMKNADFEGVVFHQFVPEFETPMLEYYLPDEDQYIYVFAFELEKLKKIKSLLRNPEAVAACKKPQDFHVQKVNDNYVISWMWDDVWYTAVSNRNGEAIVSLVEDPR